MHTLPSLINGEQIDLLCSLLKSSPPGNVVELGVYQGGSAIRLYEVCERQGRILYLYDTFQGHTVVDPTIDNAQRHWQGRFKDAADPDELQRLMPNARIIKGTFPDSMRPGMTPIAFVHSDMDLYHPTKAVCDLLPPLMVEGGRIVFDDYNEGDCPGCTRAVDESFSDITILSTGKAMFTKRANV